ncbi:hypothetical protein BDV95DRAFT_266436 [Massariosphaeria phaeospora]|uniref:Zn(2)-C6 fungal-type domain-containing protein n=1 Tax=Massariosphaeria phaeospora TaxID=100035 RepID=A0A7C8HYG7_9PLEO|nr:hypothetical protein BDV95DRAFT_266436 [Massariosphaeria phaeospora]
MSNRETGQLKSPNACESCRSRKQRCDKTLPSCSRCTSKLLPCSYFQSQLDARKSPASFSIPALLVQQCPNCLDLSVHGDRELLQASSTDSDPSQMTRLVAEVFESARLTPTSLASDYTKTIHTRLPIVDPDELISKLGSWPAPQTGDADLAALLWALYLVTRRPCADAAHSTRSVLYRSVRQMFMLRVSGGVTIELLQAGLLITYYACGHGLPQDAHLILATCATMARLMGFDFDAMDSSGALNDQRSACRWAIVLLDRFASQRSHVPVAPH